MGGRADAALVCSLLSLDTTSSTTAATDMQYAMAGRRRRLAAIVIAVLLVGSIRTVGSNSRLILHRRYPLAGAGAEM